MIEDKVLVITGSSSGIGKAIAEELSKRKVKLIFTGRNEVMLNEISNRVNAIHVS